MTTAARAKNAKTDEWDDLLATADLSDRDTKKRPTVDVPEKIVAFAQSLYDQRKAATFPVTSAEQFASQKLLWQSAGDLTTPKTSATVKPVMSETETDDQDDQVKIVGLRVSFGERRGTGKAKNGDVAETANG